MSAVRLMGSLFATLLVMAPAVGAAPPQPPVALVIEVTGTVEPALEPYSEVADKDNVKLAAGARLTFLHYATCQEVAVSGGRITFTAEAFRVEGGGITHSSRVDCPRSVTIQPDAVAGAVLFRGVRARTVVTLNPRPVFVLVGAKATNFTRIRILRDKKTIFEGKIEGRRFAWPEGEPPLAPGWVYALDLLTAGGGKPRTVAVEVVDQRGRSPLTLIRVD
ncbi:MAG: hypothetical protein IH903_00210 [Proteobacteria bacterium]|nr:hypothetical protein [Pseudomonadota bacterium]